MRIDELTTDGKSLKSLQFFHLISEFYIFISSKKLMTFSLMIHVELFYRRITSSIRHYSYNIKETVLHEFPKILGRSKIYLKFSKSQTTTSMDVFIIKFMLKS